MRALVTLVAVVVLAGCDPYVSSSLKSEAPTRRTVKVHYSMAGDPSLAASFTPEVDSERVAIGVTQRSRFVVKNLSRQNLKLRARRRVGPAGIEAFLGHIICFSLADIELAPMQEERLAVTYSITEHLPGTFDTVYLHYFLAPVAEEGEDAVIGWRDYQPGKRKG